MQDFIVKTFNPASPLFYLMISWSVIWKGIALWVAARNHQKILYVLLLVINTLGIFEIIYLLFLRRDKNR